MQKGKSLQSFVFQEFSVIPSKWWMQRKSWYGQKLFKFVSYDNSCFKNLLSSCLLCFFLIPDSVNLISVPIFQLRRQKEVPAGAPGCHRGTAGALKGK